MVEIAEAVHEEGDDPARDADGRVRGAPQRERVLAPGVQQQVNHPAQPERAEPFPAPEARRGAQRAAAQRLQRENDGGQRQQARRGGRVQGGRFRLRQDRLADHAPDPSPEERQECHVGQESDQACFGRELNVVVVRAARLLVFRQFLRRVEIGEIVQSHSDQRVFGEDGNAGAPVAVSDGGRAEVVSPAAADVRWPGRSAQTMIKPAQTPRTCSLRRHSSVPNTQTAKTAAASRKASQPPLDFVK